MSYSNYDKIAEVYDSLFIDKDSTDENKQISFMLSNVKGRVYDIGCGTGLLTELIKISPANYYGIDPSSVMLDKFIEKHGYYRHRVIQDIFENDSTDLSYYDWVVSLFGSISYVAPNSLEKISRSKARYFLMFYKSNYYPITYTKTGVNFEHYTYSNKELKDIFNGATIKEFNNYIIVSK